MNSEEIKKLWSFVNPPEKIAESNSNVSYKNFSQDSSESQIFRENSDAIDKLFTLDFHQTVRTALNLLINGVSC